MAFQIEGDLEMNGFEVLHDDREGLSPGAKFKDADLLGFPLRIMVGTKGLKEGVIELRDRRTKEILKISPAEVVTAVASAKTRILASLVAQVAVQSSAQ